MEPKNLRQLLKNFKSDQPDFSGLRPYLKGEEEFDLGGLTTTEIGLLNSMKTAWEISQAKKPTSHSRQWQSSSGYKFLVAWTNAVLLRLLIRCFTKSLPRSEYRAKAQVDDAARSVAANIEEGWKRDDTKAYLKFLSYSQGSLEEVKGDVERFLQDDFLKSERGSGLTDLGIVLRKWHKWARNPKNAARIMQFPLGKNKGGYRTIMEIKGKGLTYEMFIELINKTDWNLRRLVEALEKKTKR